MSRMFLGLTLKNLNLKSLSSCSKCLHVPHNTFLSSTNSHLWIKSRHSNQFKQHVSKLCTFSNCLQKNASDSSDSNLTDTKTPLQEKTDEISDDSTPLRINVDKEILRYDYEEFVVKEEDDFEFQQKEIPLPFSTRRGKEGVFDLHELVELLKSDKAVDICAIRIPPEYDYVDYMVIATGRTTRHIRALAEYIRWAYKKKRSSGDLESVRVEGEQTNDWFALDLGNIAVHLFLEDTRKLYDLEQLWGVGPKYDEHSQLQQQSTSDAVGAFSLTDFSFDAELERFRQIRQEEQTQSEIPRTGIKKKTGSRGGGVRKLDKKSESMESRSTWHTIHDF